MLSEILIVMVTALTSPTQFAGGFIKGSQEFTGIYAMAPAISVYDAKTDTCRIAMNSKYKAMFEADPETESFVAKHEEGHCVLEKALGNKYQGSVIAESWADLYALNSVSLSDNTFKRLKVMRLKVKDETHATGCVWNNWVKRDLELTNFQTCFKTE